MREKVVLIGAGSASFTRGLVVDILQRGWEGELALVGTNPDALGAARRTYPPACWSRSTTAVCMGEVTAPSSRGSCVSRMCA